MRLKAMFLAVMTAAVLALGAVAAGYAASPPARPLALEAIGQAIRVPAQRIRVSCNHPVALRLIRFEDGSARLNCGRRVLVRVSVPG
jgi:hypothetical protein